MKLQLYLNANFALINQSLLSSLNQEMVPIAAVSCYVA